MPHQSDKINNDDPSNGDPNATKFIDTVNSNFRASYEDHVAFDLLVLWST